MALSVDGLNTIDARETTAAEARKWVLGPYETVTISGWQTSQLEAHRFEFTTEARSYGQALGKTANLGVISAVFFKESGEPSDPLCRKQSCSLREVCVLTWPSFVEHRFLERSVGATGHPRWPR